MSALRKTAAVIVCGLAWYGGLRLFFIYSNAQQILGNPAYQSRKFMEVFAVMKPLPRMVDDSLLVLKGLMVTGAMMGCVLVFLNERLRGTWLQKGLQFGLITWSLVIPWFEFYLPYNVMHEPATLVALEALLWLGVMITTGLCVSFVLNFRLNSRSDNH